MPISLTSEHSERLLELVVRLSNRLDDPMLWEDVVCSTTSMCGFEGGALLLPDGRGGWRRAAAIALQPGDERYLDALTLEEAARRAAAPAEAYGGRVVVVPCASAAGRVEAALVLFGLRPGRSVDAALLQQLGRVLGPIIGVVSATASAREVAAAANRRVRRLHYLAESCAAMSRAGGGFSALERAAVLAGQWLGDRAVVEMEGSAGELAGSYSVCRLGGSWCGGRNGPPPDGERRRWLDKLIRTGEPILLSHLDPRQPGVAHGACCDASWPAGAVLTLLTVGLHRRGKVIGALTLMRREEEFGAYDHEDLVFAREIARHTELALDYEPATGARRVLVVGGR